MNFITLNQKAFNLASTFIDSEDQFGYLERSINKAQEKLKVFLRPKILRSILGEFYVLWSAPLK